MLKKKIMKWEYEQLKSRTVEYGRVEEGTWGNGGT